MGKGAERVKCGGGAARSLPFGAFSASRTPPERPGGGLLCHRQRLGKPATTGGRGGPGRGRLGVSSQGSSGNRGKGGWDAVSVRRARARGCRFRHGGAG